MPTKAGDTVRKAARSKPAEVIPLSKDERSIAALTSEALISGDAVKIAELAKSRGVPAEQVMELAERFQTAADALGDAAMLAGYPVEETPGESADEQEDEEEDEE